MALSPGGLAGLLLLGILMNLAIVVALYIWHYRQLKKGMVGIKFTFSDKLHGAFRWILFALITLCWMASIAATASCNFIKVTVPYVGQQIEFGMGFQKFYVPAAISNPAKCQGFASDGTGYFTGNHPAFTFAVANCLLTSVGFVGIVCIQFILRVVKTRQLVWLVCKIAMYCSVWCCICTFYVQEMGVCDDFGCSMGPAGIIQVFNVLALMISSALLFVTDCGDESAFDKCRTKTTIVRVPAGTMNAQRMG
ncbi:unnamed protein product [Cylindrotheca closterium]|uniref:Uncharacterized protein n=1 Tax=Cylindrotheca closterium TaxID=2856 RepID=A0AAD2G6F2_9STRA|nr:unnamed protein product [Cylindrotheca closterium]